MSRTTGGDARSSDESAFSLIELLVVVLGLGVLAGVVILNSQPILAQARTNSCRSDLGVVRSAANAFEVKHERYPSSMSDLVDQGYLTDYPEGSSATSDGEFDFEAHALPATVTRPC